MAVSGSSPDNDKLVACLPACLVVACIVVFVVVVYNSTVQKAKRKEKKRKEKKRRRRRLASGVIHRSTFAACHPLLLRVYTATIVPTLSTVTNTAHTKEADGWGNIWNHLKMCHLTS